MKYCPLLFRNLMVSDSEMGPCCRGPLTHSAPPRFFYPEAPATLDMDAYGEFVMSTLQKMQGDNSLCKGCGLLEERNTAIGDYSINDIQFDYFHLTHNVELCNCKCIYCPDDKNKKTKRNIFNLNSVAKALEHKTCFSIKNFMWSNGECTLHPEFEKVSLSLLKKQFIQTFYTSAIKHSNAIKLSLIAGKGVLSISIDSGTRDTYKKVKGVDKFDRVINHIIQYGEATGITKSRIDLKYILLSHNSNSLDIIGFLLYCLLANCSRPVLSIEMGLGYSGKKFPVETFFSKYFEAAAEELYLSVELARDYWTDALLTQREAVDLQKWAEERGHHSFSHAFHADLADAADRLEPGFHYSNPEEIRAAEYLVSHKKLFPDINTSESFNRNFALIRSVSEKFHWNLLDRKHLPYIFLPKASLLDCSVDEFLFRKVAMEFCGLIPEATLKQLRNECRTSSAFRAACLSGLQKYYEDALERYAKTLHGKAIYVMGAGKACEHYMQFFAKSDIKGMILSDKFVNGNAFFGSLPLIPISRLHTVPPLPVAVFSKSGHQLAMLKELCRTAIFRPADIFPCLLPEVTSRDPSAEKSLEAALAPSKA